MVQPLAATPSSPAMAASASLRCHLPRQLLRDLRRPSPLALPRHSIPLQAPDSFWQPKFVATHFPPCPSSPISRRFRTLPLITSSFSSSHSPSHSHSLSSHSHSPSSYPPTSWSSSAAPVDPILRPSLISAPAKTLGLGPSIFARTQRQRNLSADVITRAIAGSAEGRAKFLGLTWPSAAVLPQVEFSVREGGPLEFDGDLLLLGIFESAVKRDDKGNFLEIQDPEFAKLDEALGGVLAELAAEPEFAGKPGQKSSVVRVLGRGFKRLALVGLGKRRSFAAPDASAGWQSVGASLAALAKQSLSQSAALSILPSADPAEEPSLPIGASPKPIPEETALSRGAALAGVAKGVVFGSFQDVRYKSEESQKAKAGTYVKDVSFILPPGMQVDAEAALFRAVRVAGGAILSRELVNAPPNVLTPETLAQVAQDLANAHSDVLEAKILSQEDCEALGMGSYLAVAAASANPPYFIHLTYTPPGATPDSPLTKLAIVGKGLTFDSGGYNLKAGAGSMIHLMKFDMGGAAAVLGAAKAVAAIQPEDVQVHFIVAACENMVSGTGLRPGDIITASNGKTIEVNNTDAEGRLTLADALVYAANLRVHKIVDLATLTGACIVALGNDVAGLYSTSDDLAKELSEAAKAAGEKVWRMPLEEAYWEGMKSSVADMQNTGPREGGSITAALFLKQYVPEDIPWAHLDMAGPVWDYKKSEGTGYATSLLYKWVEANAAPF